MTGVAGGVDDLQDQVAGDTTAAPVRIDEEVLELRAVVLARDEVADPTTRSLPGWLATNPLAATAAPPTSSTTPAASAYRSPSSGPPGAQPGND
jgi:hypothetical protein